MVCSIIIKANGFQSHQPLSCFGSQTWRGMVSVCEVNVEMAEMQPSLASHFKQASVRIILCPCICININAYRCAWCWAVTYVLWEVLKDDFLPPIEKIM